MSSTQIQERTQCLIFNTKQLAVIRGINGTTIHYFCNPSNIDGRVYVYVCIWFGLGLGLGFAMICSGHGHLC